MKKYIGIILILITVSIIGSVGIVLNDSRPYFKEYFTAKRQKLNLRHESSVDSLITVINQKDKLIDSLIIVVKSNNDKINIIDFESKKTITNLQNVITHQNQMLKEQSKNKNTQ